MGKIMIFNDEKLTDSCIPLHIKNPDYYDCAVKEFLLNLTLKENFQTNWWSLYNLSFLTQKKLIKHGQFMYRRDYFKYPKIILFILGTTILYIPPLIFMNV